MTFNNHQLEIIENTTYAISSLLVIVAMGFQLSKPYETQSAKGLSKTFIIIGFCAIVLRLPYFILRAKEDKRGVLGEFGAPIAFLTIVSGMYIALWAVKDHFDGKEATVDKENDEQLI